MHSNYSTDLQVVLGRPAVVAVYKQVLAAVAEAQHGHGIIDAADLPGKIRSLDSGMLQRHWAHEEQAVRHETAGFIAAVRHQLVLADRPKVYLGMTSSDLIDTAASIQYQVIRDQYLKPGIDALTGMLLGAGHTLDNEDRMGRTHGRLAEPVSIGSAYLRASRDMGRVGADLMMRHYLPGKLSGPVGDDGNDALPIEVQNYAATILGIQLDEHASQIVDRFFYRRVASDLVEIIAICEQLATLHRLSAIEGVDLFAEDFEQGVQKGSSVMPHKRNPIRSERICGLARVARGHYQALLETWSTSWWERDLTNSSVERIAWWDLVQLCHYLMLETARVIEGGAWRGDVPIDYQSPTAELVARSRAGQDPEAVYREIQSRPRDIRESAPNATICDCAQDLPVYNQSQSGADS